MKKVVLIVALLGVSVFATDFSQLTTDELFAMRGSVSAEDRDAFKAEMQSRMQAMSPEERQAYTSQRRQGNGQGNGTMKRLRDGSGGGMMYRGKH